MKKLIILIILISTIACKAQTPVVSLDARGYKTSDGAYFKDLNYEFNKFEGTWLYTNGNTSLTVILEKKEMVYNGTDYEDKLIGEYQYIENGIEIVNTLPNLTNTNVAKHKIKGRHIIPNNLYLACNDCGVNERRVMLVFYDSERSYLSASIILRYLEGSNPEQMTATIISDGGGMIPNENSPTELRVPYGEYLMVKQ